MTILKRIIIFDTSYGSLNMGDFIINKCADLELKDLYNDYFCLRFPTHTPVAHNYQLFNGRDFVKTFINAKYKFIIGTNILKTNMFRPWPDWNVNIFNCKPYKESILVGAGLDGNKKINLYTRWLYKKILSKDYIHSVRDEKTKDFLESMGFKAINTGCPTIWSLNNNFCLTIPKNKAKNVIFTITDYNKDSYKDQILIDTLNKNYNKVFIWIQGSNDYDYFKSLKNTDNIIVIPPNVEAYDEFLKNNDVDYIGTRLHAGIFAIRHKKRSLILAVDNRARDMAETYNLNIIERDKINTLDDMINSTFETKININQENINKWKSQFK